MNVSITLQSWEKISLRTRPVTARQAESLRALDAVNLFVGGTLAGFGPFVALFLGGQGWSPEDIGVVLTAGGLAGVLTQIPGGELLDATRSKRFVLGLGILIVGISGLMIAVAPDFIVVLMALMLQGSTGGFIGLAITAVSLGLVTSRALPERLGRNQRFRSAGSLAAAGLMGAVGYLSSNRLIFFATALIVIPALVAVARIRATDIHFGRSIGVPGHQGDAAPQRARRTTILKNRPLLIFAISLFLFQMANASILPLIGEILARHGGQQSSLMMAILVIVPQVLVALMAPWAGRVVQRWGRRPLLLAGFGALPVRALLFAVIIDPAMLIVIQVLDGVSGIVLGVLQPLVIADLAGRGGRFNLAQGYVGLISGIGASLSTAVSGFIVGNLGLKAGFVSVALVAMIAFGILWAFMPETNN